MKIRLDNIRKCLGDNKIFFETIAATLLSVMAIFISCSQTRIAQEQTKLAKEQTTLTEIQTKLAQKQFEREGRKEKIEKTAQWGELRNAMWHIYDVFPPSGADSIRFLPQEQQKLFFAKIREVLDSQVDNPVLIENRQCLGHWRNAISASKTYSDILARTDAATLQDAIVGSAKGILEDVSYVWKELILNSTEVSSTGGRPEAQVDDSKE